MDDLDRILVACDNLAGRNSRAALATLVHVAGASFRKMGSRLLVYEDGTSVGGVSAGCLEGDVIKKAVAVAQSGKAQIARYDTGSEQEILFGWGTGCSGIMTILIEPLSFVDEPEIIVALKAGRSSRMPVRVATVIEAQDGNSLVLGSHIYSNIDRFSDASTDAVDVVHSVRRDLQALAAGSSEVREYAVAGQSPLRVFLECVSPPPVLAVYGAGPVAPPLALFAQETGWNVRVQERRPAMLAGSIFAEGVTSVCEPYDDLMKTHSLDGHSAAVVMTHSFLDDVQIVKQLLQSPVRTISVLSSRGRAEKLFAELKREDSTITPEQLARIHAPAGLEIGSNNPSQIALSIMAEIQKDFTGGTGRTLVSLHAQSRSPS